jgi:hypothetical protein
MPSIVFSTPLIAEKTFKQQPILAPEIPLAKGGINTNLLLSKPSLVKMPDIKLPQMPLPPTPL